ncbi:MAG TPA: transposase [Ignavibacteriaceae bacterium]|nr:transposase [Ignavibacteriaceae bacterium]
MTNLSTKERIRQMREPRIFLRYSLAFKQKVVSEIENGKLTISEARSLYDIRGVRTIQEWMEKLGKTHLLNKVIHIEMTDEPNRIKELERQKKELESALAQAHLKIITLESTVKVMEEKTGVKLKKKTNTKSSSTVSRIKDSKKKDSQ